jgi:alpha-glucoside transport system substrate-binding protein
MKKLCAFALLIALIGVVAIPVSAQEDDLLFPIGEGDFHWDELEPFMDMDFSGEEVVVSGPWADPEHTYITNMFAYFEYATGATVVHVGSDDFEQQILIDTEAGSPPNMAIFPQPGKVGDFAARGHLAPLGDELADWVLENYAAGQSWVDMGTFAGADGEEAYYGFHWKTEVKSLVWYVPENFADAGYEVPTTMEDLKALTEQIAADGTTPWCIGIESGGATGWPATDWVEDMMLRTQPIDVYNDWTSNAIPFDDERVVAAIEEFGWFATNPDFVNGGPEAVVATSFRDAPAGLFTVPPQCYMHRQANFITANFPEDVELGVDATFFYFPAYAGLDLGNPMLGSGTFLTILDDTDATRGLLQFMQTALSNELWMAQGTLLTPHMGINTDIYRTDLERDLEAALLGATTFGFDGSDLMPGAVGAGSFWTGMVDYIGGESAADVATAIQESWDEIK